MHLKKVFIGIFCIQKYWELITGAEDSNSGPGFILIMDSLHQWEKIGVSLLSY